MTRSLSSEFGAGRPLAYQMHTHNVAWCREGHYGGPRQVRSQGVGATDIFLKVARCILHSRRGQSWKIFFEEER